MHTFAQKPARPSASASTVELSHGKRGGTPRFLSSSRLHAAPGRQAGGGTLQRKTDQEPAPVQDIEDEEEMLQLKTDQGPAPMPDTEGEEEDILQPKSSATSEATGAGGARDTPSAPDGLPRWLTRSVEAMSGEDISDVRVHHNSSEPKKINALAYTKGKDIHVGPGQERYLPHEAWHAVQQRQGRVSATIRENGVSINNDRRLEREADTMGRKAQQARPPSHQGVPGTAAARGLGSSAEASATAIQRVAPAFLGVSAAAWGVAANVASVVGAAGAAAGGAYQAVASGENKFGSLVLPANIMSDGDGGKLRHIVHFRILNAYVERYLTVHPDALDEPDPVEGAPAPSDSEVPAAPGGSDSEVPAAPGGSDSEVPVAPGGGGAAESADRPTGAPTASAVDEAVMNIVKNSIETELKVAMETKTTSGQTIEYRWGEDDTRGVGLGEGSSGSAESVGVTGFLRFRDLEASVLKQTLTLSSNAKKAIGSLPGDGEEIIIHRFIGGSVGGVVGRSFWQDLTVNIEGGAAQVGVADNGSPKLIVRTHWFWERVGANVDTYMTSTIHVLDAGNIQISSTREGSPDDT